MIRKIKEKISIRKIISAVPAGLFLFFVIYMMINTYKGTVEEAVTGTDLSAESLETLSDTFEETLQENFYDKNNYVNLNGLTTNILGINNLNERQKLSNGYLANFEGIKNTDYAVSSLIELNDFLNERDIPFLYILAPSKASFYDADFAPGYSSDSWQNIDTAINALNEAGVPCLDMDAWFEENGWTMEDVFFKTDHHWTIQSGFQLAKNVMEIFSDQGLAEYDPDTLDESNWNITIYENRYLGYDGQRTGIFYTGTDDFPLYEPNYKTDYTYSYLKTGTTDWTYLSSPLNLSYLNRTEYFNNILYSVYLTADYPIKKITNTEAFNDKKILMMGDSFRRPFEYFISTQFTEVYGIDLRYYSDGTLAEYIEQLQPDIVIMCTYENHLSTKSLYNFGISDYMSALNETSVNSNMFNIGDITIEADDKGNNIFTVVSSDICPGQSYTLTLDSTSYSGVEDLYIQMTLQDLSANKVVYNRYFDANSDESQKWIFTVPEGSEYSGHF